MVVNNDPVEIHSHPSVIGAMGLSWCWHVGLLYHPRLLSSMNISRICRKEGKENV